MASLKQVSISIAMFVERWVLSVVFFCLAAREFTKAWGVLIWRDPTSHGPVVDGAHHVILCALGLTSSVLLLVARRAVVAPQEFKSIFVPLITTFYTVLYYAVPYLPNVLTENRAPVSLQKEFVFAGLGCIFLGNFISLWGLVYLRRSFGIYVTVRQVVLGGPYRWVRHPMYLGWVFICTGVALANFSIAYFVLIVGHISMLVYRGRLEENRLAEHSPEYRAIMAKTGFLFPKI